MSPIPLAIFPLAAVSVALVAAAFDVARGTIPNWLTLPVLMAAPLVHAFAAGPEALGLSLLGGLACGAIPCWLFTRGGIGGGDVKLLGALGSLVGTDAGLRIELAALFTALLYALAALAWRGTLLPTLARALRILIRIFQHHDVAGSVLEAELTTSVRLGPPIAAAAIVLLWLGEYVPWLPI
jgi:prepilin peptidase CpaA